MYFQTHKPSIAFRQKSVCKCEKNVVLLPVSRNMDRRGGGGVFSEAWERDHRARCKMYVGMRTLPIYTQADAKSISMLRLF